MNMEYSPPWIDRHDSAEQKKEIVPRRYVDVRCLRIFILAQGFLNTGGSVIRGGGTKAHYERTRPRVRRSIELGECLLEDFSKERFADESYRMIDHVSFDLSTMIDVVWWEKLRRA